MKKKIAIAGGIALASAAGYAILRNRTWIPENAEAVKDFEIDKFLGKWYEIARLKYGHEENLRNITAEYQLNSDGNVRVINRGYNFKKNKFEEADGVAKFRDGKNTGALKVSFFGPFYSGYNVIAVEDDYKYALIAGKDLGYLWILSRDKSIPQNIKESFLKKAEDIGYNTRKLIWVTQNDLKVA